MAYLKKSSKDFEGAIRRMASLKSIDPVLDLENGLSVETYQQSISCQCNGSLQHPPFFGGLA